MKSDRVVDTSLPGSCARAASAEALRHRVDRPIAPARAPRIIALDEGAAEVVRRIAGREWANARFSVCGAMAGSAPGTLLRGTDGSTATLADELASADVVVMVATGDGGAECAHTIGRACWERAIMTAGLVVGDGRPVDAAVAALRPHARVLLPTADESDVVELLTALRA
jgi:hypothetical protein